MERLKRLTETEVAPVERKKYCPLYSVGSPFYAECLKESCMFWDPLGEGCSIFWAFCAIVKSAGP